MAESPPARYGHGVAPLLAVVTDLPTPYRTPLFDAIHARGRVRLHVLYLAETEEGRQAWSVDPAGHPHSFVAGRGLTFHRRNGPFTWKVNVGIGRRLSSLAPDVVCVGGWAHPAMHLAAAWARRRHVPYLLTSETHPRAQGFLAGRAKRALAGRLVRRASGWLPVSTRAQDLLVSLGADPARCWHVPNAPPGARSDGESAAEIRRSLGAGSGPVTLFVGRLVPAKGLDVLLEAAARVKPTPTLWVAGGGPLRGPLVKQAGDLGITSAVRFLGDTPYARVLALCAAADVIVLPSVHEPYGVALHEGMAAGCAALATDAVGAAVDLVQDGVTGRRVPPGDPEALAAAWSELLREPVRLAAMGDAAARKASERGIEFAVRQTEDAALAVLAHATPTSVR